MSKNSWSNRVAHRDCRQLAAWDLEGTPLRVFASMARRERREAETRWVSAAGLVTLVWPAMEEFTSRAGHNSWPHNFLRSTTGRVGVVGAHGRRMKKEEAEDEILCFARLGGWIQAAAKLPAIRRALKKGMTARGVNSPYCHYTPWELSQSFPAPGKLEKLLWAVRERAIAILSAYEGQMPSWVHLTQALMVERRIGKAAVIAAARSLGWYGSSSVRRDVDGRSLWVEEPPYRAARDWLVSHRLTGRILDISDGVEMYLDVTPTLTKVGVTVTRGVIMGRYGKREGLAFLVRSASGRTYHVERWVIDPRLALHQALAAWRRQDELLAKEADLVDFLRGDETGICPLVTRDSSALAGNCSLGTEAWLRQMGWSHRKWIPAAWLIPHLEDEGVRRVAGALKREFASA